MAHQVELRVFDNWPASLQACLGLPRLLASLGQRMYLEMPSAKPALKLICHGRGPPGKPVGSPRIVIFLASFSHLEPIHGIIRLVDNRAVFQRAVGVGMVGNQQKQENG
jgi:hypothetical protein